MNYKSISDLNKDVLNWLSLLPKDIDLVVGIPRSGMLVANLLAVYMNIPMTDLDSFAKGEIMGIGEYHKRQSDSVKKALIVDDSVLSGRAINKAREKLADTGKKIELLFAAVYVSQEISENSEKSVDFWRQVLPAPRIFEWNLMHHPILSLACVDIDGILCPDPTEKENDDGKNYEHFIANAPVKMRPTVPIKWLVTCRLEKYRHLTDEWLNKNNFIYEILIMLDLPDKKSRLESGIHGRFKAEVYRKTNAWIFLESSYAQAVQIAKMSNKVVVCTDESVLVYPNQAIKALSGSLDKLRILKSRIKSCIKRK